MTTIEKLNRLSGKIRQAYSGQELDITMIRITGDGQRVLVKTKHATHKWYRSPSLGWVTY